MAQNQVQNQEHRKSRSTTIYAPIELKEKVIELSKKIGKPQWKVLLDAVVFYESIIRKPRKKEELPIIDKIVWYIEKLCLAVGALRGNPSNENLQKLLKITMQISERLAIDTSILDKAIRDFIRVINTETSSEDEKHSLFSEAVIELDMALKSVLLEIIYRYMFRE